MNQHPTISPDFDKSHAGRAWCDAIRLNELAERRGVSCKIIPLVLSDDVDLELLERDIRSSARDFHWHCCNILRDADRQN